MRFSLSRWARQEDFLEVEEPSAAVAVEVVHEIHYGRGRARVAVCVEEEVVRWSTEKGRTEVAAVACNGRSGSDEVAVKAVEVLSSHTDLPSDGHRTPCWAEILE